MARRSPQTAAKRAREQAKRERREHKQAKRAARNAAATDDAAWGIVETVELSPSGGGAHDAAYRVTLASGSATQEIVVEYATGSHAASSAAAEEATRPFLRDERPPQHLVVATTGTVTIRTERGTQWTRGLVRFRCSSCPPSSTSHSRRPKRLQGRTVSGAAQTMPCATVLTQTPEPFEYIGLRIAGILLIRRQFWPTSSSHQETKTPHLLGFRVGGTGLDARSK